MRRYERWGGSSILSRVTEWRFGRIGNCTSPENWRRETGMRVQVPWSPQHFNGSLVQRIRARRYERRGWGFESLTSHKHTKGTLAEMAMRGVEAPENVVRFHEVPQHNEVLSDWLGSQAVNLVL